MLTEARYDGNEIASALSAAESQVSFLGTGSFGETWRVRKDESNDSAYKILYRDGYLPELLVREIDGLSRVAHPGVVKLLNSGTVTISEQKRPYLQFEYIEGGDLALYLEGDERPVPDDIDLFLKRLLEAVEAIHGAELVHRDIKPANIALRGGRVDNPVILDLGLAKSFDAQSLTIYPHHIGSPPYMSPEQLRGERAKTFSDLWGVGVVVAEIALGRHPFFSSGDEIAVDEAIRRQAETPDLSSVISPAAQVVVEKLLSVKTYRRGTATSALQYLRESAPK